MDVDERLLAYYARFDEGARLGTRSAAGRLELRRTQELLAARLGPSSRVLDVGGATGVHAAWLRDVGHSVRLVDPIPRHVEAARAAGLDARIGDARALDEPDASFDAVLLLGPLYHLSSAGDRAQALSEAARVVPPGGLVAAAAISRYARLGVVLLGRQPDAAVTERAADLLATGTIPVSDTGFPRGHAHTAEELERELVQAGLEDVEVLAVEGSAGLVLDSITDVPESLLDAAAELARLTSRLPGERDVTNHLLGFGRRAG